MESFTERVYRVVEKIPPGSVATYQDVARLAGNVKAVRAVGVAMRLNPDNTRVPCHRVVGSDGQMRGYAFGGVARKLALLKSEGVHLGGDRANLNLSRWRPREEIG